ncbi:bromo-adjacent homology (BAH) domain-containing protein [Actinidia rufa]|uniref:Bromo-adjacent homology (BAH) domain-containing protein n=1 Tax=Actinidia rufa TaxID=165716 RepID=A0A7J0DXZ3_9ERIC|nr:bromo-adjacent homology (BAH) domain-containing protein [Actinidia rufa]
MVLRGKGEWVVSIHMDFWIVKGRCLELINGLGPSASKCFPAGRPGAAHCGGKGKFADGSAALVVKCNGGRSGKPRVDPLNTKLCPIVGSSAPPPFQEKKSTFVGHLCIDKIKQQTQREMREAVSTSHCSQPNTIEYEMAMEWCVLQSRSERWWKQIYKVSTRGGVEKTQGQSQVEVSTTSNLVQLVLHLYPFVSRNGFFIITVTTDMWRKKMKYLYYTKCHTSIHRGKANFGLAPDHMITINAVEDLTVHRSPAIPYIDVENNVAPDAFHTFEIVNANVIPEGSVLAKPEVSANDSMVAMFINQIQDRALTFGQSRLIHFGLIFTSEGFVAASPRSFDADCGNDSSRYSIHLRSRLLSRLSTNSPPDNRAHLMANTSQTPDLEGIHFCLLPLRQSPKKLADLAAQFSKSPKRWSRAFDQESATPIKDMDARIDVVNIGTNAPVTLDALIRQTEPPFTERVMEVMVSSRLKLSAQLGGNLDEVMCKAFSATLKGSARSWFRKLSPRTINSFSNLSRLFVLNFMSCRVRQKNASHLFTVHQKDGDSLKDYVKCFKQVVLEVEDPSDKVVVMVDKYIAVKELIDAKRRRRGKDDHKRKEPERRTNYRGEVLMEIENEDFVKRPEKIKTNHLGGIRTRFGSEGCPTSSRKRHVRAASEQLEEAVYNLSTPTSEALQPITFTNEDLRGLHFSHDDALVISATIVNFNV